MSNFKRQSEIKPLPDAPLFPLVSSTASNFDITVSPERGAKALKIIEIEQQENISGNIILVIAIKFDVSVLPETERVLFKCLHHFCLSVAWLQLSHAYQTRPLKHGDARSMSSFHQNSRRAFNILPAVSLLIGKAPIQ